MSSNPRGRSNGLNADGSLMNVGNKLSNKPSIRLWKDRLAGGSGNAMKAALTDEAMGIVHEGGSAKTTPQLKAEAKRLEAEKYKKEMEAKRREEQLKAEAEQKSSQSGSSSEKQQSSNATKQDPFLQMGLLKGIKIAVEDGASVNEPMPQTGWTALHYAAVSGKGIVINYLLKAGADKAAKDVNGQTPYDIALSRGKGEHVKEMLAV
eukprot:jgi/Bigna1/87430/estExt_fgenesh1_pg.C_200104